MTSLSLQHFSDSGTSNQSANTVKIGFLAACLLGSLGMPKAIAALEAYDPFNQSAGPIAGTLSTSPGVWPTGGQIWSTNGAGDIDIVSGSLPIPPGVISPPTDGNRAVLTNTGTQNSAFRNLGVTYNTATDTNLWFSFLFRQSNSNSAAGRNDGISLASGTTGQLFIGSDGVGDFVIRAIDGRSATPGGDQFANTFQPASSGETFFLVMNILAANEYKLWLDPTGYDAGLGVPTGGIATNVTSNLQTFTFDTIELGGADPINTSGSVTFDEFRMGTSAADVVVPEPSTYALVLLGAGALYALRRRGRS